MLLYVIVIMTMLPVHQASSSHTTMQVSDVAYDLHQAINFTVQGTVLTITSSLTVKSLTIKSPADSH
jgi:hypothetical protein